MKRTVLNRILIAAGGILLLPVLFVTGRTYGVLCRMVPSLGRSFHSKTLISGGAFDQSGLLNLLLITLLSVLFILSAKLTAYAVPAFRRQPHRLILNAVLSIAYLLPIYSAVVFTWHLFRLIAVMGITPERITGVRISIGLFAVPFFSIAWWFIRNVNVWRILAVGFLALTMASATVWGIDGAARHTLARQPRPTRFAPRLGDGTVPEQAETPTVFGLREILFGIPESDLR